jgi:hypothetical protein
MPTSRALEDRKQRIIDALLNGSFDQKTYDDQMVRVGTALEAVDAGASERIWNHFKTFILYRV